MAGAQGRDLGLSEEEMAETSRKVSYTGNSWRVVLISYFIEMQWVLKRSRQIKLSERSARKSQFHIVLRLMAHDK